VSAGTESYAQAGPPGNDRVGLETVHDDQLLPAACPGDDPHVPPRDPELVGEQAHQGVVRGTLDGRGADADTKHPLDDAIDTVSGRARRQADGEADVDLTQDPQIRDTMKPMMISTMNPDQSIIPVCGSIRRTGPRMGSVVW
jgi:hypothetical protein